MIFSNLWHQSTPECPTQKPNFFAAQKFHAIRNIGLEPVFDCKPQAFQNPNQSTDPKPTTSANAKILIAP